jgi:hypothetical protein
VLGNDTGSTCDCPAQSIGGKCQAGTFCPEGSSAPISCLGGHYCDVAGLDNVTGECLPGNDGQHASSLRPYNQKEELYM